MVKVSNGWRARSRAIERVLVAVNINRDGYVSDVGANPPFFSNVVDRFSGRGAATPFAGAITRRIFKN